MPGSVHSQGDFVFRRWSRELGLTPSARLSMAVGGGAAHHLEPLRDQPDRSNVPTRNGYSQGGWSLRMGRRGLLAALATLVTAAAGMSACGDAGGGEEQVTLTILEYQQPRAEAVATVRRAFEDAMERAGRDIKVKLVRDIMPDDQFKTKITKQYNAGEAPDVTDLGASMVPAFAGAGYLLDLTPYLEKWKDWKSFYPDVRDQIVQPDGKIYALPHEANTQNLFYRRDVLERLGVSTEQPT